MERAKILLTTFVIGLGVALTYYLFEGAVHQSIQLIWNDWLNTGATRWLVVPACLVIGLLYFGVQHRLDPRSEGHESHGLGDTPSPTATNFTKVLAIGFMSLLAGASLGPEAILVPACTILGSYIGLTLIDADKQTSKLLGMAGFIALFAAFFNSFWAGMFGLLLVRKRANLKLSLGLVIVAVVAAASTVWLLGILDTKAYVSLPPTTWHFDIRSLFALIVLLGAGYAVTYGIGWVHQAAHAARQHVQQLPWWGLSIVASSGLAALYLLGGSLVEFTGNKSIIPMLHQAAGLGTLGLLWLVVVKIAAIGWSKALGYRGGMIFPTIFVASVLVAIAHNEVNELNFIYGLLAVLIGALVADRKVNILV